MGCYVLGGGQGLHHFYWYGICLLKSALLAVTYIHWLWCSEDKQSGNYCGGNVTFHTYCVSQKTYRRLTAHNDQPGASSPEAFSLLSVVMHRLFPQASLALSGCPGLYRHLLSIFWIYQGWLYLQCPIDANVLLGTIMSKAGGLSFRWMSLHLWPVSGGCNSDSVILRAAACQGLSLLHWKLARLLLGSHSPRESWLLHCSSLRNLQSGWQNYVAQRSRHQHYFLQSIFCWDPIWISFCPQQTLTKRFWICHFAKVWKMLCSSSCLPKKLPLLKETGQV